MLARKPLQPQAECTKDTSQELLLDDLRNDRKTVVLIGYWLSCRLRLYEPKDPGRIHSQGTTCGNGHSSRIVPALTSMNLKVLSRWGDAEIKIPVDRLELGIRATLHNTLRRGRFEALFSDGQKHR